MTARFYGEKHRFFGGILQEFLGDVGWHSPGWKGKKAFLSNPKNQREVEKKSHRDLFLKNPGKTHLHQRLHHWSEVITITLQWRLGFLSSCSGGSKLAIPYSFVYTDLWTTNTRLAKVLALRHLGGHTAGGCATAHDDRNFGAKKTGLPAKAANDMNWSHRFWFPKWMGKSCWKVQLLMKLFKPSTEGSL